MNGEATRREWASSFRPRQRRDAIPARRFVWGEQHCDGLDSHDHHWIVCDVRSLTWVVTAGVSTVQMTDSTMVRSSFDR